jgi:predicted TIM-barrel fold metal-dependent hydrolase
MYEEYMPKRHHEAARRWWIEYTREMLQRTGTFFDQEATEAYVEGAGEERGIWSQQGQGGQDLTDDALLRMMSDESSAFAPRRGEFDMDARRAELDADGVAGEVVFPQMAPFGAGLIQYRHEVPAEENWAGIQAYNRWLADFCKAGGGRQAGVALINVDDIDASVAEIRAAKEMGLFGGVLLPTSTGSHPYYHDPRYEPIWQVCAELDMPVQSHSGWSPDYGDVPAATAMYITEVAGFAHRPFAALVWSGAFERHPNLKLVFTETGCSWILETLRLLDKYSLNPIFKYFTKGLSLTPREYFARQCWLGASFLGPDEGEDRHRVGLDRYMWGTDYPHLEGTWPNTMDKLRETFGGYPEGEIRAMLGDTAVGVYGFDRAVLDPIAEKIGPEVDDIRGDA